MSHTDEYALSLALYGLTWAIIILACLAVALYAAVAFTLALAMRMVLGGAAVGVPGCLGICALFFRYKGSDPC